MSTSMIAQIEPAPAAATIVSPAVGIADVLDVQRATASLERELAAVERRIRDLELVAHPESLDDRWIASQLAFARRLAAEGLAPPRDAMTALLVDAERAVAMELCGARDAAERLLQATVVTAAEAGSRPFAGQPAVTGPVVLRGVETASAVHERERTEAGASEEAASVRVDGPADQFWQELAERDAARHGFSLGTPLTMLVGVVLIALALAILG